MAAALSHAPAEVAGVVWLSPEVQVKAACGVRRVVLTWRLRLGQGLAVGSAREE